MAKTFISYFFTYFYYFFIFLITFAQHFSLYFTALFSYIFNIFLIYIYIYITFFFSTLFNIPLYVSSARLFVPTCWRINCVRLKWAELVAENSKSKYYWKQWCWILSDHDVVVSVAGYETSGHCLVWVRGMLAYISRLRRVLYSNMTHLIIKLSRSYFLPRLQVKM